MSKSKKFEKANNIDYFEKRKNIENIFSPQIEIFVPGAQYVDPSRLNMTAKQISQTVISKNCETPYIISKEYEKLSKINSVFQEIAEDDGIVMFNNENLFIFYYTNQKKLVTRYLSKYKKLVNISISLKYVTDKKTFKKGELLWSYLNIDKDTFLPKIGYRTKIAYMPFFGYNADDAVVISESFAKKTEVEYSAKVYIPILKNWKYVKKYYNKDLGNYYFPKIGDELPDEDIINYYLIDVEDHFISDLYNLNEENLVSKFRLQGIEGIHEGKIVDQKIHFNINQSEFNGKQLWELNEEEIKKFFEEKKKEYIFDPEVIEEIENIFKEKIQVIKKLKEEYIKLGINEQFANQILNDQISQYFMLRKLPPIFKELFPTLNINDIDFVIEYEIEKVKRTTRGDKFTNLYAGKATVAMIIPDELMPKDPQTGKPIDLIFNTLGIPGRNNWGTIFESLFSKIIESIENSAREKDYEKVKEKIKFINENFIKLYDKNYYQKVNEMLSNFDTIKEKLIDDINTKKFYLFIPNFLLDENHNPIDYKTIYDFVEKFQNKFNDIVLDKVDVTISKELIQWLREKWNFKIPATHSFKDFTVKAQISSNYILKLHHVSFSKYNSINFTTSYNKITGQPVRGRKKKGGQHISWQSLAALLAHKENNAVLKELYTIKSDSIKAKKEFIMKYLYYGEYDLNHAYDSTTKKTINNALKVFGMKFTDE